MILDIGCGNRREHWIPNSDGLDLYDFGQRYIWNLENLADWPIESNSYNRVVANHIMEHISSPAAFIHILNEIWRVTTPRGIFEGAAPHFPSSPNYYRDPFHVRPINEFTFDAFLEGSTIHFNDYGVKCVYRKTGRGIWVNDNRDICWTLEIVK